MAKKILKSLTNNFVFKLLAFIFAFMLWLVVYNIEDPVITRPYTAIVSVKSEDKIKEMNKCYEILDASNIVSFSVSAKRSIIEKLEDSDFTAVADMNNIMLSRDKKTAQIRIDISSSRYSSFIKYSGKSQYLSIALENLLSKQFVITPNTDGTVAAGYALGTVSVMNPNVLKVSGPESVVENISSIVATIDVDGMTMDLSDNVIPVLYDKNGKEFPTTNLKLSNSTVQISAQILGTKEIPVKCSPAGAPAGGNRVLEVVCKPSKVQVKGPASALNQISSIEIPANVINVSGITEDLETTIDITEYLPEHVELVDIKDANVSVVVKMETHESRRYTLDTEDLIVKGLSNSNEIRYGETKLELTVSGRSDDISQLTAKDIKGTIDVTGLEPGTHFVNVHITLDEELFTWTTLKASVTIVEKENQSQEDEGQDSEDNPEVENPDTNGERIEIIGGIRGDRKDGKNVWNRWCKRNCWYRVIDRIGNEAWAGRRICVDKGEISSANDYCWL